MWPVRLTARLVTIVLVVVAFYVRPISIVFATGGFLLGLGIRYAKAHWSRVGPILKRVLITFLVGGLGLFPIVVLAEHKRSAVNFVAALIVGWMLLPAKIRVRARALAMVGLVGIWLGMFYIFLTVHPAAPQRVEFTRYSVQVDQSDDGKIWIVRTEALFNLSTPTNFSVIPEVFSKSLVSCGWNVDSDTWVIKATRQRTQDAKFPWLAATSVNTIYLEEQRYCEGFLLLIPNNSQAAIFASDFTIAKTYPDATRSEVLGQHRERLLIPMNYATYESPTLRFEVINPLFQNWAGAKILEGAFWFPLQFIGAILGAIFSEQIKGSILVPFMRRLYTLLGLKWYDEDRKDGDQERPRIIIP